MTNRPTNPAPKPQPKKKPGGRPEQTPAAPDSTSLTKVYEDDIRTATKARDWPEVEQICNDLGRFLTRHPEALSA